MITTTELVDGPRIDDVMLRVRPGTGESSMFSRRRLRLDIENAVIRRVAASELDAVISNSAHFVEDNMRRLLQPLTREEAEKFPAAVGAIQASNLRERVELELQSCSDRVAHIQYAMSFRGRVDADDGTGFQNARQFLDWLWKAYPDLRRNVSAPDTRKREKWQPTRPRTMPKTVLKRDGTPRTFVESRLRDSLTKALLGRKRAIERAEMIAHRALWQVAGQETVLSGQLAAAAMGTLRRVDDIAYLRYAGIAKKHRSVNDFLSEAISLVEQPSPTLSFNLDFKSVV